MPATLAIAHTVTSTGSRADSSSLDHSERDPVPRKQRGGHEPSGTRTNDENICEDIHAVMKVLGYLFLNGASSRRSQPKPALSKKSVIVYIDKQINTRIASTTSKNSVLRSSKDRFIGLDTCPEHSRLLHRPEAVEESLLCVSYKNVRPTDHLHSPTFSL